MENTKYGKRREGRWTPIRAKAQDTRANPNSWETHLVRKRWDIGLLRALSPRIMMMMMRPPGGPRKIFNSKRGPQPKKFGNRCPSQLGYDEYTDRTLWKDETMRERTSHPPS